MKSQNATATLGNIISCPGQNVLVPLDVTGFFEIGAMTYFIGYDTNAVAFVSLENINPAIPGWISINLNNGQVALAYSSLTPFDLDGEKLFDLNFSYLSDSTDLTFLSGTEIANINLEIIPLDTYSGDINNSIQIINQPDSVQAYPDNDVSFNITVIGTTDFQWQENSGSEWIDLQNNFTYSGVTTNTLFIYDVTLDFNGNNYRCVVTADECTVVSDAALLEVAEAYPVASLGFISSCPDNIIYEPLLVGDFFDVIEFTFNISFNPGSISFVDLTNINSELLSGTLTTMPVTTPPGVSIHWEDSEPVSFTNGILFDLIFDYVSGSQSITFETGSIVINSSSNPVDITFNDGGVEQFAAPIIVDHPNNVTINEFESAFFTVEVTGADNYMWMVSTDDGLSWSDLTNTPPYFNVNTGTLTINPVVYSFNGNSYKCRLNNTECMVYSNPAILTVDTLTFIKEQPEKLNINIFPVPFIDVIQINLSSDGVVDNVKVYNAQGKLMDSFIIKMEHRKELINIDLSYLSEGVYFIEIIGEINGKSTFETKKIVKIK